ncbi:phage major capsid protein [Desulfosporosinus sp. Sb-LF]|uniref:phage major capsid protein n=1 Tax=Desulfosporosinus sp. Sb-LF TaxID=2560027 RepID=UPI00107F5E23|nr:phage major capsid protein [Desulfosporosinus sp. Sb-LF]TGE31323.1 phage major capsid protein [Desulfosporosinus sp. Sb-LF]
MNEMERLLALKATLKAKAQAITAKESSTTEEINAVLAEIQALNAKIEVQKQVDAMEAEELKAAAEAKIPVNEPLWAQPKDHSKVIWKNNSEFLSAVYSASKQGATPDPRLLMQNAASGMGESVPSDGGFLVGEDFAKELLQKTYETGILASKCRKIPISPTSNALEANGIDETSRANGSRWGGIQSFWENEADGLTGKKPKFNKVELKLKKLTGLCYATDELLQDAVALESIIGQAFAEEFGFKMDDAIMNGLGAGQPLGFMKSGALVTVSKEAGQANGSIVTQNVLNMWSRCWGRSRQDAVWLINQDVEPQLSQMTIIVGTGGVPVYMPAGGVSGAQYSTLFGRPVIPVEQANTIGSLGDISLVDLSQYLLIDKGGINAASSIHVRFLYDESVFRFIYRVDGQPIWKSALTPFKGSNTLSPFVTLAAR